MSASHGRGSHDAWPARNRPSAGPLAGVRVLELSTLLPGPMAALLLADAGADVLKVERPSGGDEMRSYTPRFGPSSANFALLNRGKRGLELDLKTDDGRAHLHSLVSAADVLIEQFRPGVADRLGFGSEEALALNPSLIYCSITGYGQHGPNALRAGHDLTYLAETGMLALASGPDGAPPLPPALIADIAGGAYPAVMNILLALRARESTGRGCHLDVSMADNLFPLMYWALGAGFAAGQWPRAGAELVTGGSARYRVYATADGRYLAAAPLEQRFWEAFCEVIGLAAEWRSDDGDPEGTARAVAALVASKPAAEWARLFDNVDACVSVVATLDEAVAHPQFASRVFTNEVVAGEKRMPALPSVWAAPLRSAAVDPGYPLPPEHA